MARGKWRRRKKNRRKAPPTQQQGRPEPYEIEFYETDDGSKPVLRWIKQDLTETKRRVIGSAIREVLQQHGINVCQSEWGKQLGGGVFEFRVRMTGDQAATAGYVKESEADKSEQILLRVFCHAHGQKIILLLAAYDKGEEPGDRRQQRELELARKRLRHRQERIARAAKKDRRQRKKSG